MSETRMGRRAWVNGKPRNLAGWIPDRGDHRDRMFKVVPRSTPLPSSVDLRQHCSQVEDQGDIGSCTANSSTSAVEFLYRKMGIEQPELSRFFLYYATRVYVALESPADDSGAQIRDTMKALAIYGTCLETSWPYKPEHLYVQPSKEIEEEAKNRQIQKYYRLPGITSIKSCLAQGYPVVGGFSVPVSFMEEDAAKTGIATYPGKNEEFVGGHAVLFVGYNDQTRQLIFQNSWGEKWGDQGFGYLPYEFILNGLADDFWTIHSAEM